MPSFPSSWERFNARAGAPLAAAYNRLNRADPLGRNFFSRKRKFSEVPFRPKYPSCRSCAHWLDRIFHLPRLALPVPFQGRFCAFLLGSSKQGIEVMWRHARRHIDRLPCFSSPNRTRFSWDSIWFGDFVMARLVGRSIHDGLYSIVRATPVHSFRRCPALTLCDIIVFEID